MTRATGQIALIPQNSNLTRRAALTGMALLAAPSTALAVCVLPTSEDPIYEAIAAYKRGHAHHLELLTQADVIEQRFFDEKKRVYKLIDDCPEETVKPLIEIMPDLTFNQAHTGLKQLVDAELRERCNMDECYRLRTVGSNAECDAMDAMLATVPTTRAGALALIELVLGETEGEITTLGDMFAQDESVATLLRTIASHLRLQA